MSCVSTRHLTRRGDVNTMFLAILSTVASWTGAGSNHFKSKETEDVLCPVAMRGSDQTIPAHHIFWPKSDESRLFNLLRETMMKERAPKQLPKQLVTAETVQKNLHPVFV